MAFFETPVVFQSFTNSVIDTAFVTTQDNNELNTATIGDYTYLMRNLQTVSETPVYVPTIYRFDVDGNYIQIVVNLGITDFKGYHILNNADALWLFYKYSGEYYYVIYNGSVWGTPVLIDTTIAGKTGLNNLQISFIGTLHMLIEVQTAVNSYLYHSSNMGTSWTLIPSSTGASDSTFTNRRNDDFCVCAAKRASDGLHYIYKRISGTWDSGTTLYYDTGFGNRPKKYPFAITDSANNITVYYICNYLVGYGTMGAFINLIYIASTGTTSAANLYFNSGTPLAYGSNDGYHSRLNIYRQPTSDMLHIAWINSRGLWCHTTYETRVSLGITKQYESSIAIPCWFSGNNDGAFNYITTTTPVTLPDVSGLTLDFVAKYNTDTYNERLGIEVSEIYIPEYEDPYWSLLDISDFDVGQTLSMELKDPILLSSSPLLTFDISHNLLQDVEHGYIEINNGVVGELLWNSGVGNYLNNRLTITSPIAITSAPTLEYNMNYHTETNYDKAYIEVAKVMGGEIIDIFWNSGVGDDLNNSLTTTNPIAITSSPTLEYNLKYEISEDYDYAYIEIAKIVDGETIKLFWNSGVGDDLDNSLTTISPIAITSSPTLEYNMNYIIEEDYDYAYIEISNNSGVSWTTLKTYTGTLTDWTFESINLSAYIGSNILLRVRYTTDYSYNLSGFNIKDIVIKNNGVITFSDSIDASLWTNVGFIAEAFSPLKTYTGALANWTSESVDLSAYIGFSVLLRLRCTTLEGYYYDGLYIKDIIIKNNGVVAFSDSIDPTLWNNAGFTPADTDTYTWVTLKTYHGLLDSCTFESVDLSTYIGFNILLRIRYTTDRSISYSGFNIKDIKIKNNGVIAFSDSVDPTLWRNTGFAIIDPNAWVILDTYTGSLSEWTPKSYDLASYIGFNISIRFRYYLSTHTNALGMFYIKNIRIEDNSIEVFNDEPELTSDYWDIIGFEIATIYHHIPWQSIYPLMLGSSSGWISKSYSLDAWKNKTIYIRFLYTVYGNTAIDGVYFGDIKIKQGVTVLDTLTSGEFTVSGMTYITDNSPLFIVALVNPFVFGLGLASGLRTVCGSSSSPTHYLCDPYINDEFTVSVPELREDDSYLITTNLHIVGDETDVVKGIGQVLYAYVKNTGYGTIIFYGSQDGGVTWTDLNFNQTFKFWRWGGGLGHQDILDSRLATEISIIVDDEGNLNVCAKTTYDLAYACYNFEYGWFNVSTHDTSHDPTGVAIKPSDPNYYVMYERYSGMIGVPPDLTVSNGLIYMLFNSWSTYKTDWWEDIPSGERHKLYLYFGDGTIQGWMKAQIADTYNGTNWSEQYQPVTSTSYGHSSRIKNIKAHGNRIYFVLYMPIEGKYVWQYYSEGFVSEPFDFPVDFDDSCGFFGNEIVGLFYADNHRIYKIMEDTDTLVLSNSSWGWAHPIVDDDNVIHLVSSGLYMRDANKPWERSLMIITSSDYGVTWSDPFDVTYNFGNTSTSIAGASKIYYYDTTTHKYSFSYYSSWRGSAKYSIMNGVPIPPTLVTPTKNPMFYKSSGGNWVRVRRLKRDNGSNFISEHNDTTFKLNNIWNRGTV